VNRRRTHLRRRLLLRDALSEGVGLVLFSQVCVRVDLLSEIVYALEYRVDICI